MASRTSTALVAAGLGGAVAIACGAAACGLSRAGLGNPADDGGILGERDATRPTDALASIDGDTDEAPPGCTTVDAACLGPLPQGWAPVLLADAGCSPGYTSHTLLANPRLGDGGCACGACQILGAYDCDAAVAISGGDGCGDPTLISVAPGTCGAAQAQHVEAHPPAATGSVGCFAPNDAGAGVTTDSVTLCLPGCAVDYCQTGQRCVVAVGDLPCPAGFTLAMKAGSGADPGCAPCGCEAGPPGTCGGTVTVYDNASCTDSGAQATYPVGACNQYSTTNDYESVLVSLTAPAASCTASPADDGDASLTGVKTICCQ
jgi:hypothetical protein